MLAVRIEAVVGMMCRLKYTVRLQAALQPGDAIQSVNLVGSMSNDTGERPILAYLYGPDANLASTHVLLPYVVLRPLPFLLLVSAGINAAAWQLCSEASNTV